MVDNHSAAFSESLRACQEQAADYLVGRKIVGKTLGITEGFKVESPSHRGMEEGVGGDVLSDEPVMPLVPIKPNNAIPVTIGIIMLLGALLLLLSGGGEVYTHFAPRSPEYYEQMASGFSQVGIDTNASEVEAWDGAFQEANFHLVSGIVTTIASIGVFASAVLFIMKKRLAVKVGISSAAIYVLSGILIQYLWASRIESQVGISMETPFAMLELVLGMVCSLLCLALPLMPLFIKAGNAALIPHPSHSAH